jgi:thiamine pyrophosphokinase
VTAPIPSAPAGPGTRDAFVLAGGDPVDAAVLLGLPAPSLVVAADGGLALAGPLGLEVDVLVGDLDSVDPVQLAAAEAAGTRVERHPVAKDATDLALALFAARDAGADRITVVGGHGGRADHLLANWLLLASHELAGCEVRARSDAASIEVVRPGQPSWLAGEVGAFVSLIPVHGAAHGVTTGGLRFPLDGGTLEPGSSRGVSNEFSAPRASVELTDGVLLAVRPRTDPGPPT